MSFYPNPAFIMAAKEIACNPANANQILKSYGLYNLTSSELQYLSSLVNSYKGGH